MILYGPDGSGKKTRAMCFLDQVFGDGVYRVRSITKIFKVQGTSTDVEYSILESNHHIDLNPSLNDRSDRHVINNAIKESASMGTVEKTSKKFKVVIINEADKLTKEAQASLRRTMQKYTRTVRLILICEAPHKLMAPIRSRCLSIRINAPDTRDILTTIQTISQKQGLSSILNRQQLKQLAEDSHGNVRKALLSLQLAASSPQYRRPILDDWKQDIQKLIKSTLINPSQEIYKISEDTFYKILVSGVDGEEILRELVNQLLKSKLSEKVTFDVIHKAAESERNMNLGDKPIFHLIAFLAYVFAAVQAEK